MTKTIHAAPPIGDVYTPCCGKRPTQLPIGDLITKKPQNVTCGKGKK